ncbi:MAG: hypothetical protein Q7T46_07985 [Polaromonas sp.]|nr:hypothetical protein [Polaromonas sp.]
MKSDTIIFSLTVEDVQTVAVETLDRKLTKSELRLLVDPIHERIHWFDAVQDAIRDCLECSHKTQTSIPPEFF